MCVKEFHQTNQETFIWLLAMEVAISCSLSKCISSCKVLTLVETGDSTTVSMTAFVVVKDTYNYYDVLRFTVIVDKSFGTM